MQLKHWIVGLCAAAIAGTAFVADPAEAAPRKRAGVHKRVVHKRVVIRRGPRTRITVRRRSFLDPGTEPIPGQSKQFDYAFPPGYVPTQVLTGAASPSGWQNPNWPLPGAFHPWPP